MLHNVIQARYIVLLILIVTSVKAQNRSSFCHINQPIINADFQIICSNDQHANVEIICKTTKQWHNIPSNSLNLTIIQTITFRNCSFPPGLSLLNVTTALGLGSIHTIVFDNCQSTLSRINLRNITVSSLQFRNSDTGELPKDLLYDISINKLFIIKMGLTSITKEFFKASSNLSSLEIFNNKLSRLKCTDFDELENLEKLALFGNKIKEIEPGTFDKLVNLRDLEIHKNSLRTLPAEIFKNLTKLENVNLSQNKFINLPADLLRIENSVLESVRLSYNRLTTLPSRFFGNLSNLNYVELESNNLSTIPPDVFSGAESLMAVNINNNSLVDIPRSLFKGMSNLKEVWLSENLVESLPDGLFEDTKMQNLYLNHNRFKNLTSGISTGLTKLNILHISHNNLIYIDENAFQYMMNIEHLDLSYNKLTFANSNPFFKFCDNLKDVNLSYNEIAELFEVLTLLTNLKNINLVGNKITSISADLLHGLKDNVKLNLQHNQITTIQIPNLEQVIEEYRKYNFINPFQYTTVYMEHNPLKCDCDLLHFFCYYQRVLSHELELHIDDINCLPPHNSSTTADVTKELKCLTTDACSETCSCWNYFNIDGFYGSNRNVILSELGSVVKPGAESINCSKMCTCWGYTERKVLQVDCSCKSLTAVPMDIINVHNWSIELNLSGNKLRETPSLSHSYLLSVTVLDLSNNNITRVSMGVFSTSLRALKLHNNSISRLDSNVVEYLLEETTLSNVTLQGNNWICDCETHNLLNVIQKKSIQLYDIMCYGTNRRLSAMTVKELCNSGIVIVIFMSLMIALLGVVVGALAALYFRHQKEVKVWLYSKQWCLRFVTEDELDKDKRYDAFISYSHKDEDFVVREIVPKLEVGPSSFKLCLHYRDWLAGEWIPAQIARSVEVSRRTIVVLSPNFLESVWGRMEFRTAHSQALSERRARVIVILYGDIGNTEDLDPELKAYLSMNTYVKWGDPWFWDKLRYALPHKYETTKRRTLNVRYIEDQLAQL